MNLLSSSSLLLILLIKNTICESDIIYSTQSDLTITLTYLNQSAASISNIDQTQSITIYQNNNLQSNFNNTSQGIFDCENPKLFILNQTVNSNNPWLTFNFNSPIIVQIQYGYSYPISDNTTCTDSTCIINLVTNCTGTSYSTNYITGTVYEEGGNKITSFYFYTQCNYTPNIILRINWGHILIVVISTIFIFISSKFQQALSFDNFTLYINYIVVAVYSILCLAKFFLIYYNIPNIINIFNYICIVCAFFFGIIAVWICFCQFCHFFNFNALSYRIYNNGRLKFRIMDVLGIITGIGFLCAWFFSNTNMIISDIIFVMIYLSLMKIVKIGSLYIAMVIFFINFVIFFAFHSTAQGVGNVYVDSPYTYFNNPMFLLTPVITHIPNRKCSWYSILTFSFEGFILCYLQRLDKNKSSKIYAPTFFICYVIGCALWLIVGLLDPYSLPYDLFIIPISVVILLFFANRRGEMEDLLSGQFFDQQKEYYEKLSQMKQDYRTSKKQSLNQNLFEQTKYNPQRDSLSLQENKNLSVISNKEPSIKSLQMEKKQTSLSSLSRLREWFQK